MALNYLSSTILPQSSSLAPPSSPSSLLPPSCSSHPQEMITNFCCLLDCLEPLCPECIDYHNKFHKQNGVYPEIDTLKNVRSACFKKVRAALLSLSSSLSSLSSSLPSSLLLLESGLSTLSETRQRVLGLVNRYFDSLEDNWRKKAAEGGGGREAEVFFQKARVFLEELGFLQASLENGNNLLGVVKKVCALDLKGVIDSLKEEGGRMLERSKWEDEIAFDQERIGAVERELIAMISIKGTEVGGRKEGGGGRREIGEGRRGEEGGGRREEGGGTLEEKVKRGGKSLHASPLPSSFRSPPASSLRAPSSAFIPPASSLLPPLSSLMPSPTFIPPIKITPLKVSLPDFFDQKCKDKVLHFFPNNQKVLHYIDFNEMKGDFPGFSTLKLDIDFRIPHFHKSVITPMGEIYLTGGTPPGPSPTKSRLVFLLDWSVPTLLPSFPMLSPRSSHAICYSSGFIYVIGGFTTGQSITTKCEKLRVGERDGKRGGREGEGREGWKAIASLNLGMVAGCVCGAGEKYLFKFGGLGESLSPNPSIERYDIERDLWKLIQIEETTKLSLSSKKAGGLLSTSACLQINRNEILIFGGYNEDNEASNSCWVFCSTSFLCSSDEAEENYENGGRNFKKDSDFGSEWKKNSDYFGSNMKKNSEYDWDFRKNSDNFGYNFDERYILRKLDDVRMDVAEGFWTTGAIVMGGRVWGLQNVANEKNDDCLENERRVVVWDGKEWKNLN